MSSKDQRRPGYGPVHIDLSDQPMRFTMSGGESARSDVSPKKMTQAEMRRAIEESLAEASREDEPAPAKVGALGKVMLVCAAVLASAAFVYWVGAPWTYADCLMEASKRRTNDGVSLAETACIEKFKKP